MAEDHATEATRTHEEPVLATREVQADQEVPEDRAEAPAASEGVQQTLPTSPETPPPATPDVPTETSEQEVAIRLGERRYRVRGLARNLSHDGLRVNLLAALDGDQGAAARLYGDDLNP